MDTLVTVIAAIRTLCRHSYGPSGEEVLVFAPPDAPLITADGHAVLLARRQQDETTSRSPFERVILDAAEGVYREVGDGTTQFVLLLHGVLAHLASHGVGSVASRVRMARALSMLRHQWDTQMLLLDDEANLVIEEAEAVECDTNARFQLSMKVIKRLDQVLTTALTGCLGRQVLLHIVRLVLQWVFQQPFLHDREPHNALSSAYRRLQSFLRHAPDAVIHAQGSALTASYVVPHDEFVLRKSLIPSQLPSVLSGPMTSMRFVCLIGSIDPTSGSNQIVYSDDDGNDPTHALSSLRSVVTRFLAQLREHHGVRLIATTEKVEDYVAAACNQLRIACVQYAEREDVDALCSIAGICPLASVFDVVQDTKHIGVCERRASVTRQSQTPSIHLRGIRRPESTAAHHEHVPQLIIYASSKGVYKQYYNAVLKSLRVLRSIFAGSRNNSPSIRLYRGAGAAELSMAKALGRREGAMAAEGGDPSTVLVCQALSTALVETVAQLRANINQVGTPCSSSLDRQSTRTLLDEMSRLSLASTDREPARGYILDMNHAISTRLGSIVVPTLVTGDPLEYGVIHAWQRMETIIHTVLQTAEMLLRVDAIVRVKRDVVRQSTGLHEAMEDGDEDD